jgi:hypothetical protein
MSAGFVPYIIQITIYFTWILEPLQFLIQQFRAALVEP